MIKSEGCRYTLVPIKGREIGCKPIITKITGPIKVFIVK